MTDWPDEKIHFHAVKYIDRHSMDSDTWTSTVVGRIHSRLVDRIALHRSELPVVSCFLGPDSWYVLTVTS